MKQCRVVGYANGEKVRCGFRENHPKFYHAKITQRKNEDGQWVRVEHRFMTQMAELLFIRGEIPKDMFEGTFTFPLMEAEPAPAPAPVVTEA